LRALGAAVCAAIVLELGSGYLLYRYYAATGNDFAPSGSATRFLAEKVVLRRLLQRPARPEWLSDPEEVFVADPLLGFRVPPGHYTISAVGPRDKPNRFEITIGADGWRRTAARPVVADHQLLVLGASELFGWGLYDEQTMPWILQSHLQDWRVVNRTGSALSTVGVLLSLERLPPAADDLVVVGYQEVVNHLNVMSPEMLRSTVYGMELEFGDADAIRAAGYPYARLDADGELQMLRTHLSCEAVDGENPCHAADPDPASEIAVTLALFERIHALLGERLIVIVTEGSDADPVPAELKALGIRLFDLRGPSNDPATLDWTPNGDHPGPYRHAQLARQLKAALATLGVH